MIFYLYPLFNVFLNQGNLKLLTLTNVNECQRRLDMEVYYHYIKCFSIEEVLIYPGT